MTTDIEKAVGTLLYSNAYSDCYRLRRLLKHPPDVVYDVGACLGTFSLWAGFLFPQARIVVVEPHREHCDMLSRLFAQTDRVSIEQAAIGCGPVQTAPAAHPAHRIYANIPDGIVPSGGYAPSSVPVTTLADLYARHGGDRYIVKLDCEGAETTIFEHRPSASVLMRAAMVAGELHYGIHYIAERPEPERAAWRDRMLMIFELLGYTHRLIERCGDQATNENVVFLSNVIADDIKE